MEITIPQLRAARALLGWSQGELADRSGLSLPTIKRLETGSLNVSEAAKSKVREALESAGIEFINTDESVRGVRLRRKKG